MRLLELGSSSIASPAGGYPLRNYHLARALARLVEVTYVGFGQEVASARRIEADGRIRVILMRGPRPYTPPKLVRAPFGRTPISLWNYYSRAMARALASELATVPYDIVQIEGLEMCVYLPVIRKLHHRVGKLVVDWHNVESEVFARHLSLASTRVRRLYLQRTVRQLRAFEEALLRGADLHLVTSERERQKLLGRSPEAEILLVENGTDVHSFDGQRPAINDVCGWAARTSVLFVGAMDYWPNVDAALWFADHVWPQVHELLPGLRFVIVGRNPTQPIRDLAVRPATEVTGTVPDVRPYYRRALCAVVPLRAGGGTRLKILESMSAGVPVISTGLGAEGLRAEPGIHFAASEAAGDFASQIARLRADFDGWRRFSGNGLALVESTYDWDAVGAGLATYYFKWLRPQDQLTTEGARE